ncbi:MAG: T9SS type A sorting domain-containing protein [Candidatus Izemoplasmatales bacterium]|nr:T9SS type A sorting domain-containing protein [Candidatus Izemoplasmatales bacterium]
MKTKIYSLTMLLAACVTVMAMVPQKKAFNALSDSKNVSGETSLPSFAKKSVAPAKLPSSVVYVEDFEDKNNTWTLIPSVGASADYSGLYVGSSVKTSTGAISAAMGDMYLVSDYDSKAPVNAWAISNVPVELTQGVTYWVSAFFMAPDSYGAQDMKITMGATADTTHTTVLIDKTGANAVGMPEWTLVKASFTVPTTGSYYFGFNHKGAADSWYAAMDYFMVSTTEPQNPKPMINGFTAAAWNSAWSTNADSPKVYVSSDSSIVNVSADCNFTTDYKWTVSGAEIALLDDGGLPVDTTYAMSVTIPANASVVLSLKASNAEGDTTAVLASEGVFAPVAASTDTLTNLAPSEAYNKIGAFGLSTHSPMSYAESFEALGKDGYAALTGVSFTFYEAYLENYADSMCVIRILGADENGRPNNNWEFGRYTATYASVLGNNAYIASPNTVPTSVTFPQPIGVKGKYFVVIDLPQVDTLTATVDNNYVDLLSVYRGQTYNSFRPYTAYLSFNDADGWMNYAEDYTEPYYSSTYGVTGYADLMSLAITSAVTFGYVAGTVEEPIAIKQVTVDNQLSVYPNPAKDMLYISNLADNSIITISDITGKQLVAYSTNTGKDGVSISGLSTGLYIMTVRDAAGVHTAKFVKE